MLKQRVVVLVVLCVAATSARTPAQETLAKVSLSFEELKALASWTVKEKQVPFRVPTVLATMPLEGAKVAYVFPGDLNHLDAADYPLDLDPFKLQLRLELLRYHLPVAAEERPLINAACERAETHVRALLALTSQVPADMDRFKRIESEKRGFRIALARSFEDLASKRGYRFGGILQTGPDAAWTLATTSFIPFGRAHYGVFNVALVGPIGVEVLIMTNLKRRIYELRNVPQKDWQWGQPYVLNPKSPPVAFLTVGANYYFFVSHGAASRMFEKRIDPGEVKYLVPVPTP